MGKTVNKEIQTCMRQFCSDTDCLHHFLPEAHVMKQGGREFIE